ncbi:hypothetical protein AAVH_42023, partial [Aphelenchoides avenae]
MSHASGFSYFGQLRPFLRDGKENAAENVDPVEKQQVHELVGFLLKELRGDDP